LKRCSNFRREYLDRTGPSLLLLQTQCGDVNSGDGGLAEALLQITGHSDNPGSMSHLIAVGRSPDGHIILTGKTLSRCHRFAFFVLAAYLIRPKYDRSFATARGFREDVFDSTSQPHQLTVNGPKCWLDFSCCALTATGLFSVLDEAVCLSNIACGLRRIVGRPFRSRKPQD
jgi:hypothetical protein